MPVTESQNQDTLVVPTLLLTVDETGISIPQHQDSNIDMELESIVSSLDKFVIKKKTKLIIDKKIILEDRILKKWRQDINMHCRVSF